MRNIDVLREPLRNKGTAFTAEERERLGTADLSCGRIFPPAARMREVALAVATAVAEAAFATGVATHPRPPDLAAHLRRGMYAASYSGAD